MSRRYQLISLLLKFAAILTLLGAIFNLVGFVDRWDSPSASGIDVVLLFSEFLNSFAPSMTLILIAWAFAMTLEDRRSRAARPRRAGQPVIAGAPVPDRYKHEPLPALFDDALEAQRAQRDFEVEVALVLGALSGYRAEVNGDEKGIAVKIFDGDKLIGIAMCLLLKSEEMVRVSAVYELMSAQRRLKVPVAYMVTTGRFTPSAIQDAFKANVRLIDGDQFAQMRQQSRVHPAFLPRLAR